MLRYFTLFITSLCWLIWPEIGFSILDWENVHVAAVRVTWSKLFNHNDRLLYQEFEYR